MRTLLTETLQATDGLRPFSEFINVVRDACEIKKENPALKYKIIGKIGKGGFGTIFKVVRHEDQQIFALKFTNPRNVSERQDVINECSLISYLNCEQLINCVDVYDF